MPLPHQNWLLYLRLIMVRIRAALSLMLWIALIGMAVIGLHSLERGLPAAAIWSSASVELAVGAATRLLGLAAGYWLLMSTLIYLLATLGRLPAAVRSVDWATLPWVRRMADRISVRAVVRVLAAPLPLLDLVSPGYVPVPAGEPLPPATNTMTAPLEALPAVAAAAQAIEVVIQTGDNMWRLAETRLRDLIGRSPTDAEIAPYWWSVVEANRPRIRSGDPDLIFPGEVLILPPV